VWKGHGDEILNASGLREMAPAPNHAHHKASVIIGNVMLPALAIVVARGRFGPCSFS
jgi:hypothetical protein